METALLRYFLIIAILFCCSVSPSDAIQKQQGTTDLNVLEERVKQNEEKTAIQLEALDKRTILRIDNLDGRLNAFAATAVALLTLLTFFSWQYVKWLIDRKVSREIENNGKAAISKMIAELQGNAQVSIEKEYLKLKKDAAVTTEKLIAELRMRNIKAFTGMLHDRAESEYTFYDWFYKGLIEYQQKDYGQSVKSLERAVEINQTEAKAYSNIGEAYRKTAQIPQALAALNKAIKLDSNDPLAYFNRGCVYADHGEHEKALVDFNKTLELYPGYQEAYISRGNAYLNMGRAENAIDDLNKAIDLDPQNSNAYDIRSNAYLHLNDYKKALGDSRTSLKLRPDNINAALNYLELLVVTGNYHEALTVSVVSQKDDLTIEARAIYTYFECIAKKLSGDDTAAVDARFDSVNREVFSIAWSFDEIESWLKRAKIKDDMMKYCADKTEALKQHKT